MGLSAGTRLGPFEILPPLGAGGMGEVKARDIDPGFDLVTRYDVAPDGRFLAPLRAGEETPAPLVLVLNWAETLKKP